MNFVDKKFKKQLEDETIWHVIEIWVWYRFIMKSLNFACQNIKNNFKDRGVRKPSIYAKAAKSESIKDKDIIAINQTHILETVNDSKQKFEFRGLPKPSLHLYMGPSMHWKRSVFVSGWVGEWASGWVMKIEVSPRRRLMRNWGGQSVVAGGKSEISSFPFSASPFPF